GWRGDNAQPANSRLLNSSVSHRPGEWLPRTYSARACAMYSTASMALQPAVRMLCRARPMQVSTSGTQKMVATMSQSPCSPVVARAAHSSRLAAVTRAPTMAAQRAYVEYFICVCAPGLKATCTLALLVDNCFD